MKIRLLVILILATHFFSCNTQEDCCTSIDTAIHISVMSVEGEDLLNPDNPNAIQEQDIRLFYEIDGKNEMVLNGMSDTPFGFTLIDPSSNPSDNYIIWMDLNSTDIEEYPITYIQWNEVDLDTIKAQFDRGSNYESISRVWYNGNDVTDEALSDDTGGILEIIKR